MCQTYMCKSDDVDITDIFQVSGQDLTVKFSIQMVGYELTRFVFNDLRAF